MPDFLGAEVYGHSRATRSWRCAPAARASRARRWRASPATTIPQVTLPGDRVIFSSRTIPGNEKAVGDIINGLIDQGVKIIADRTRWSTSPAIRAATNCAT